MKNLSTIIALLTVGIIFYGCENKKNNGEVSSNELKLSNLKLHDRIIDSGDIFKDTTLVAKFYFENTGESDLIIESVLPDCKCTGYILSEDTLSKGKKGYIELTVDTRGKFGPMVIDATLEANTETRFYNVKLKANIIE